MTQVQNRDWMTSALPASPGVIASGPPAAVRHCQREFFIDNLLVRIRLIIEMIW